MRRASKDPLKAGAAAPAVHSAACSRRTCRALPLLLLLALGATRGTAALPVSTPDARHAMRLPGPRACDAGGGHAPLLDDVPPATAAELTRLTPAFLALADMAYGYDMVSTTERAYAGPCLSAWGARAPPVLVGRGASDADRFGFVFRTRRDVFVSLRGMDGLSRLANYTIVTPVFDPEWFGAPALKAAPPPALPLGEYRLLRPFADPELFWIVQRHYDDARFIDDDVTAAVGAAFDQMDPSARSEARVWLTGHSSGGALAQLLALRLAQRFGQQRIGGVLVFNSDRAGSEAFAHYYDGVLGSRTLRYGYGLDNANMVNNMAMGLRYTGRAFWACPVRGEAVERLVSLPLGVDHVNVCKGLTPWPRSDDLETEDDVARRWRFPLTYSLAQMSTIAEWSSFAHHLPPLLFDSLLRILGPKVDGCTRAALALPQCVVSQQCAAALRPAGPKCRTCASDATCQESLGAGYRCDSWPRIWRSNLCYRAMPFGVPPTLGGLLWGRPSPAARR